MGCHHSKHAPAEKQEVNSGAEKRKSEWQRIRDLLPRQRTPEAKMRRIELFKEFDKSGNGTLTLEEVYQGCINILHLDEFTPHLRDIVARAFNKAREMGNKVAGTGSAETVEFNEFRLMLCYIYDFFELTVMFDEIDRSGNLLIDRKELAEAVPKIKEWGLNISDSDATFDEIDKNHSGSVTFDEFAAWAAAKRLDADGDPDNEAA